MILLTLWSTATLISWQETDRRVSIGDESNYSKLAIRLRDDAVQDPLRPLPASLRRIASWRNEYGVLVSILDTPGQWTPEAVRDYARFLWEHWPGQGSWALVLARTPGIRPATAAALLRLRYALAGGSGPGLVDALAQPDLAEALEADRRADLDSLGRARSGDAAGAAAELGSRTTVNPWIAIEVLQRAGRADEARALAWRHVEAHPDDQHAADFLRTSVDPQRLVEEVPLAAMPYLVVPDMPDSWPALVDAGFEAFRESAWRRGLAALRFAHASSPAAEAMIRERLRRELPSTAVTDALLAAPDLLDGLDEAARTLQRASSGR